VIRLDNYFDYNATTPPLNAVVEAMTSAMRNEFGNASSQHSGGVEARYRIEKDRRFLAGHLGCEPEELVFTSGGTEGNNLALRGAAFHARRTLGRDRLAVSATEHKAVLDCAHDLETCHGFALDMIPVDREGFLKIEELGQYIGRQTAVVSVIGANNEIGSLNDLEAISREIRNVDPSIVIHSDLSQALGKIPVDLSSSDIDIATFCAHKLYGPKGIGAVYIRKGVTLEPQITGGGQESGRRAGSEDVASIHGFRVAAEEASNSLSEEMRRLMELRENLWEKLFRRFPSAVRNSPREECLPNTLNVSFPGFPSQQLVRELDQAGIYASAGSACTSGGEETSHVLQAIGAEQRVAESALRLSLGRWTTRESVDRLLEALEKILSRPN